MQHAIIFRMFLTLCSFVFLLQGCSPRRSPKIVFPKSEFQFPEPFIVGSEIVTTFPFANEGNAPLRITSVDADCGCVATNLASVHIPPGGSGTIQVNVNQDVGQFRQNIYVQMNDSVTPVVNLQVSGVILPAIAYPPKINLEQLEKGQRVSKKITLTNNLENTVEITGHTVSNKNITVTLPQKSVPAGESMEIEAVLTLNDVGLYSESLTLSAQTQEALPGTDSNTFEMPIQFEGRVLGGIVVLPQNLFLGVLDGSGKSVQRKVYIKTDGSLPFALKKVSADNFSVSADLAIAPQTAYEVELSITPKPDSGSSGLIEGMIQISTNHPDVPKITIPVKAVRQ